MGADLVGDVEGAGGEECGFGRGGGGLGDARDNSEEGAGGESGEGGGGAGVHGGEDDQGGGEEAVQESVGVAPHGVLPGWRVVGGAGQISRARVPVGRGPWATGQSSSVLAGGGGRVMGKEIGRGHV